MLARLLLPLALLLALCAAPSAHAAAWLPLAPVTDPAAGTPKSPQVAVDDAGNVYAVWILGGQVQASKRPVGGVFEAAQTLDTTPGLTASEPDIAVDGAGNAVAAWHSLDSKGTNSIQQARRAAGASSFASA